MYDSFNPQGLGIIAPSILMFGTAEQKQRWAMPILRAEITAALGMSEPNAGSDLAGLRTRAALDGDEFVVNGQKVWTSGAHDADVIFTFVRTDPDAPKHKGLSALIIPTDTPGVTADRSARSPAPTTSTSTRCSSTTSRVPVDNLVGEVNQGWRVATGALGEERAMLWLSQYERLDDVVENFADQVRGTPIADDPLTQDWYGTLLIDAMALRLLGYRTVAESASGQGVGANSRSSSCSAPRRPKRAALHALETLGPDIVLDRDRPSAPHNPWHLDVYTRVLVQPVRPVVRR